MRLSEYNICLDFQEDSNQSLLIQGVTGSFDIIEKKYVTILDECRNDSSNLQKLPKDIRESLIKRGYVTAA